MTHIRQKLTFCFIRAISLLKAQGRADEANQLRDKVQGIVKLDTEAVA